MDVRLDQAASPRNATTRSVAAYPDAAERWLDADGDLQHRLLLARYAPAPRRRARTSW